MLGIVSTTRICDVVLNGLNDSYAQTRAPSKVFALVVQEERQRTITHGIPSLSEIAPVANAVSAPAKQRREKPICSHCGVQGHTIHKCYKIHGYPPRTI